jgi:hypothetical protein
MRSCGCPGPSLGSDLAPRRRSRPQQERQQQRPQRGLPRDVAQDAERHAGLLPLSIASSTRLAAPLTGSETFSIEDFGAGIQAFIHKRRGGHVIGYGRESRSTNGNRTGRTIAVTVHEILLALGALSP